MKKTLSLLLSLLLLSGMLAGCSGNDEQSGSDPKSSSTDNAQASTGDTLIIRIDGDPKSFNPTVITDDNLYKAAQNMYHRLTKLDASKTAIPDAAESWDVTDEGKTITWHLKDGLKWWDGEALTADDVKYTFDYIKNNSCYFTSSMGIVDSIDVVDPLTVIFHMNTADVSFVARVGWYGTFILPEHIFNNGQKWEDNPASVTPVGSGPYKFESYTQGSNITLVANEDYVEGAPKIKKLIYSIIPDDATAVQALLNGEVDYIDSVPGAYVDQLKNNSDIRMILDRYPSPYRIIFNVNADIVKDVAVRKAIALCINREDISEKAYAGIMPPEYCAYPSLAEWVANTTDTYPKQDIEAAKKVLEDAGYKKDASGFYVTGIEWEVFEGMQDMANLIIASCKEAGIDIKMNLSEYNAWSQKVGQERNFMMEAQGGFMGPDPAALFTRYGTGSGSNYAGWSNAKFDAACKAGAATGDTAERAKLYREAQKIIVEELPAINIVGYASYTAMAGNLHDMPDDGAGQWGWADCNHAYFN
ncbi:MAG: ABC transporter substrate-binding protein [Clostridiaceae bacterium]|nr:ABC transporter substrate-binding protein [Clostridiaceae bacterium]